SRFEPARLARGAAQARVRGRCGARGNPRFRAFLGPLLSRQALALAGAAGPSRVDRGPTQDLDAPSCPSSRKDQPRPQAPAGTQFVETTLADLKTLISVIDD